MDESPRPADVGEAGALLLRALAEVARSRPDVRDALRLLLDQADAGAAPLADKVLTPRPGPPREELGRPPRKVDLSVVVRRARWKAAACRLAVDRRAAGEGDEETARLEESLRRQRTSLEDCWAWMLDAPRGLPEDRLLLDVASCYDTVALAAETTLTLEEAGGLAPKPPAELLYLLAESQSALLSGLHKCDLRGDSDQRDLFLWLKEQTTRHRIYVDRHMRLDDPAESTGSEDLRARLQDLLARRTSLVRRGRVRVQLLNKLRYHASKSEGTTPTEADLRAVEAACAEWLEVGLPVADADLVDLVRGLAPDAAEAAPATAQVLAAAAGIKEGEGEPRRDVVGECRALVEGRHALLLGGEGQAQLAVSLAEALGLAEVRLVDLAGAAAPLEAVREALADESLDLVLIAHRLSAEDYASFKQACMDGERPFVRLPGEPTPEHVAHQVLRQVAWRLRQERVDG